MEKQFPKTMSDYECEQPHKNFYYDEYGKCKYTKVFKAEALANIC